MAADNTTVLITGTNRGVGRGFVEAYLARPSHTVIASVRDPASAAPALYALPRADSTTLIVVKINNEDTASPAAAISELQSSHGINRLDVVISNAAISKGYDLARNVSLLEMSEHFDVNVLGTLTLFQATAPLLDKTPGSKFVAISSAGGSIAFIDKAIVPNIAYGVSKAALNYLVRKIAIENQDLIIFAVHPGWVQTEMGNGAAKLFGLEKGEITTEESATAVLKIIDSADKQTSATFKNLTGEDFPW